MNLLKKSVLWSWLKRRYRQLPVRRKLMLTTLVGSTVAASVAGVVLFAAQVFHLTREFEHQLHVLAEMASEQASSAVLFEDRDTLRTIANSIRRRSEIHGIQFTDTKNEILVSWGEIDWRMPALPPGVEYRTEMDGWHFHTVRLLVVDGKTVATLVIGADFLPILRSAVLVFVPTLAGVVAIAAALGGFVTALISRLFFRDLEAFTVLARRVAATSDFSLRAPVVHEDELGTLGRAFNLMLDRLQEDDAALRAMNDSLAGEIRAREKAEGQLLESSRLAGMAEVATGVLHNVGNVLNSVNVSAQLIQDTVGTHPRLALLRQTVQLMRSQGEELPRFLFENPRGRLVPRLIMELGEEISLLQKDLVGETRGLVSNIEHIKQIVATQQNYAKTTGVFQAASPRDIVDEALRIAQASVLRHGVAIEREIAEGPDVVTDRHQVLQILVNFVTNAAQAVKELPAGRRRVALQVSYDDETVNFGVRDNGVGIAPENLDKIFQHGFTTRKDGHGFGLHSGAVAARNLGGSVRLESEGVGQGACFWLELPLNSEARVPNKVN